MLIILQKRLRQRYRVPAKMNSVTSLKHERGRRNMLRNRWDPLRGGKRNRQRWPRSLEGRRIMYNLRGLGAITGRARVDWHASPDWPMTDLGFKPLSIFG